jgi:3-methyladenine DNA glycosylase AlkC
MISLMTQDKSITSWFGANLASILAEKITKVHPDFDKSRYLDFIKQNIQDLSYSQRVELHADALKNFLPDSYSTAVAVLMKILGRENPNETGMFTHYYWILPIGKFVEKYGLADFETSMFAIQEITKRNTGEYAIRPFIRQYPQKSMKYLREWSKSTNFHLRRLAAEGCRPKLPWATKLETFIDNPKPVLQILDNLITDEVRFVQKSVANNLADYIKVNQPKAAEFIHRHQNSRNKNTQWILKHATRKLKTTRI